jgi:hypothetical protein
MGARMKYVFFLGLLFGFTLLIYAGNDNAYLDKTSPQYRQLLSILREGYNKEAFFFDDESKLENVKKYYSLAIGYYNQKKYETAIDNYIDACKIYTFAIVYYQLGLCLMDAGDYETTKVVFEKSINLRGNENMEEFVTFDANGVERESYFSYYNIACIESLLNKINSSYEYLCQAIYHGYPYIDHIKRDADLRNLFTYNNGVFLREVEKIYNAGSNNLVAGKGYEWAGGNAAWDYYFIDNGHMLIQAWSVWPDPGGWISAEYEIRNYIIIAKNIQYHYDEKERWKSEKLIFYVRDFVSLGGDGIYYEEVPVKGYDEIR